MPAPITRAKIISRAKPRTRLTMVRPPIVPVVFQRFIGRPPGGGQGQAWPISPAVPPLAGRLSCAALLHVERVEIDRVEQQRREAASCTVWATICRAKGKRIRGASASRKGWSRSSGDVPHADQAGIDEVDREGGLAVGGGADLDLEHDLVNLVVRACSSRC